MGEGVERVHEDLAHHRRRGGREREREERHAEAPAGGLPLLEARPLLLPQAERRRDHVEDEQEDGHRDARDRERVTVGVPVEARNRRHEEGRDRDADEPELGEQRSPVELRFRIPAEDDRHAEHEEDVGDHASGNRAADDVRKAVGDGEERDDQLRRVPEAGVEQAAESRARVLAGVLSRLADQPGERHERHGGEGEERRPAEVEREVGDERGRGEGERRPEDLPAHGR